ncbi:hypothetical protein B0H12DRAFT_1096311 [Mycena haematopus]|nr:hypothetical protein B0H12DRAFT_1096311 [Mycena haematopus]
MSTWNAIMCAAFELRALSRLRYLLNLPASKVRIIRLSIVAEGLAGSVISLRRLPTPWRLLSLKRTTELNDAVDAINDLIDAFEGTHLLKVRVERMDVGEGQSRMGLVARRLRHYLDVHIPYRTVITRMMLPDINLNVERLRYLEHCRDAAPRHLCRFCHAAVNIGGLSESWTCRR